MRGVFLANRSHNFQLNNGTEVCQSKIITACSTLQFAYNERKFDADLLLKTSGNFAKEISNFCGKYVIERVLRSYFIDIDRRDGSNTR